MNNVIMIRMEGIIPETQKKEIREQLIREIKEGLFIVDDAVKEVVVSHFDDLGVDFNVREEEQ